MISPKTIIFNKVHEKPRHVANKITCIIKQYLYRQHCNGSTFTQGWVQQVKQTFHLELFTAKRLNRSEICIKEWIPYYHELFDVSM